MLRLRCCIITQLISYPSTSLVSPLHRLLSAAAAPVSPEPGLAVEDYLVDACGLTRAQALKSSAKLSHLKSPSKPDAVLAFLAGLGLPSADVALLVAKDPQILCAKVEGTLAPVVDGLTGLGLSRSEIARLLSLGRVQFRCRSVVSSLQYYLHLFGSFENLLLALRNNAYLLSSDMERTVKPNVVLLRECGLGDCDIAKLCLAVPWLLSSKSERVRSMVACAEGLGVPHGSRMFRHALHAVANLDEENITVKVECLKKLFRWSDAETSIAVSGAPNVLTRSKENLQRKSEFLISEVGLEPSYIASRSVMICLSLEGRLRPRYCVLKFLKANGLLDRDFNYCTVVKYTEKVFTEKFICPHKEAAPHLAEDYDAACRGEVPTNFRFT